MKTLSQTHTPWPVAAGSFPLLVLLLCAAFPARAETFRGDVTRFSPTTGQPVFPAGNLNVFKQYVVGFDVKERVGKTKSVDLLFETLHFGGEVSAGVQANFGIEFGLCFGGNADFDLAFQPTVTLPDQYPFEVALPLTVSEGLLPDSHFTTTFPPLPKAYADLIFDMGAQLKAKACVFGCFDALDFNFSTCDIPPLPTSDGPVRMFNRSVRCDPTVTAAAYCSIELASFNRDNDNKLRMINVTATNSLDFIAKPYLEYATVTGTPLSGRYGSLSISAPTVATDSRRSTTDDLEKPFVVNLFDLADDRLEVLGALPGFRNGQKVRVSSEGTLPKGLNSACIYYVINSIPGVSLKLATSPGGPPVDIIDTGTGSHHIFRTESAANATALRSSGAEDIMGIGINVAQMAADFIFPPPTPPLAASGKVGAVNWNYTLAGLDLGPAIQLETEFEMKWHLEVTGITFRQPGTSIGRPVKINGQTVTNLAQVTPAKIYHLSNRGPNALPLITLLDTNPVQVDISYVLKPNLKTVVSTPFIGSIKYKALAAGASISRVGDLRFGPLIEGEQKFKASESRVFNGAPSPITSGAPRSEYALPKDLKRYDLRLLKNTPPNSVPNSGCAVVMISESGGILNIRIFDPSGTRAADGAASSLLVPANFANLTSQLTPFPNDESGLLEAQKQNLLADATALSDYAPGRLTFIMKAAGPPSFDWKPGQLAGNSDGNWTQEHLLGGGLLKTTNWRELLAGGTNSFPGKEGPSSYAQVTNGLPHPTLSTNLTIATLNIGTGRQLTITNSPVVSAPKLTVGGGLVDNYGTVIVSSASSLWLTSSNTVLCGPGTLQLNGALRLGDALATDPVTFVNYNTINGGGSVASSGPELSVKNMGTILAGSGDYLTLYAGNVLHHGVLEARATGFLELGGTQLDSSAGSRIVADTSSFLLLGFESVEHRGLILATNGGTVNFAAGSLKIWNAGQSFTDDVGFFRAEGANSVLAFNGADMNGGNFYFGNGGSMLAVDTDFTGSLLQIGDLDTNGVNAASASLTLIRSVLTKVSLNNYGTVNVPFPVEFRENVLFANHGTVEIPTGGILQINEVTNQTSAAGASAEAMSGPGTVNATAGALVGGTWDVAGTLLIDGASFISLGANAARASTGSGSADTNGIIALDSEDDLSRVLSLGDPAKVILRGTNWSFPALASLNDNRGRLWLVEGARFPEGTPGSSTPAAFTNKNELHLETGSQLVVGGSFVQTGPLARTDLTNAALTSVIQNYQILGGQVNANAASTILNRSGNTIPGGTTIRVESPLLDTGKTNIFGELEFEQYPVIVNLGSGVQIHTIASGASVTIHGAAVQFPALTDNLRWNAGTFTASGDGIDNAARIQVGQTSFHALTNTGQVKVLGFTSGLRVGDYVQSGGAAVTRIGAGSSLTVFNELAINGGEIVVEIASRPADAQFGQINVGSSGLSADFGNQLVIDFTGELAGPSFSVDIGDTWEIMPRTSSAGITGTNIVTYRLNGSPLPAGWLPAGSHLAVIQFTTPFGLRGLGIRVVPDSGFTEYGTWAAGTGFPTNQLSNLYRDVNANGILNGLEYLFGTNAAGGVNSPQVRHVVGPDANTYIELSYVRPSSHPNATYTPYFSHNMMEWYPAPMAIVSITPGPGPNLETVILRSEFPDSGAPLFFRIQADLVPDSLDAGLIPEKPLVGFNVLNNLGGQFFEEIFADNGYYVSYRIGPGQELFFNVSGKLQSQGGTVYGTGRYRDWSSLQTAAVHAGVLAVDEQGVVKVTFLPELVCYQGTTTNGVTSECYPFDLDTQTCCTTPGDMSGLSFVVERAPGPFVVNAVEITPPPTITNITHTNNGVLIEWSGPTTAQYQVQWKSALAQNWNSFSNTITSPTGQFSFLDDGSQTGGLGATRFYRLVQLP